MDNVEFSREYDFSRTFCEQFAALLKCIYLIPLSVTNGEGSDFVNGAYGAKGCYLCFGVFNSQDCMYGYMLHHCSDCLDCVDALRSQYCYDCHTIKNSYECRHCRTCTDCVECALCEDCIGCHNCVFSYGLRNAEYYVANEPVGKEKYLDYLRDLALHTRSGVAEAKRRFTQMLHTAGHRTDTPINCENSTGHFLTNTHNVLSSFYVHNADDCGYLMLAHDCRNCWRGIAESADLAYQASAYFDAYCSYNSYMIFGGSFNLYSAWMFNACSHCFGCAGLNKKSYCILNRQYTKEEYFDLVPRIIEHMKSTGEWGNFFPPSMAPHYYEYTLGSDWFEPLPPAQLAQRGYRLMPEEPVAPAQGLPTTECPTRLTMFRVMPATGQSCAVSAGRALNYRGKKLPSIKGYDYRFRSCTGRRASANASLRST